MICNPGKTRFKEFNQEWETHGPDLLFKDVPLDQSIKDEVLQWFYWRRCAGSNREPDRFPTYFNRLAKHHYHQFVQYLRVENTDFDPMVNMYMERLLENSSSTGVTVTNDGRTTVTGENTTTGLDTTKTAQTTDNEGTSRTTGTTEQETHTDNTGKQTVDGTTSNDTTSHIVTVGEVAGKTGSTTDVTETTKDTGTSSEDVTGSNTSKQLNAQLPNSTSYGAGMPTSLNWSATSAQQEGADTNTQHTEGKTGADGTRTGKTTLAGTSSEDSTTTVDGTVKDTGTNKQTTDTTDEGSSNTTGTTTSNVTDTSKQEVDATVTRNTSNTGNSSSTQAVEGSTETKSEGSTQDKERYAGRRILTPQTALNEARDYITRTNAFTWYLSKLEPAFIGVFEV